MMVPVGVAATVAAPLQFDTEDPWAWDATPTVTVTDVTGDALPAPTVGADPFAVTLNSEDHTHRPDRLTVTWAGDVDSEPVTVSLEVEVVGSLVADLVRLRATPSTTAAGDFSDDRLIELREEFLDLATEYLGWSPVQRVATKALAAYERIVILDYDGATVRSVVDADGTEFAFTQDGPTVTLDAWSSDPLTVVYVHGAAKPPHAATEACVAYVRATANQAASGVDRDAISVGYDGTTTRYSTADWAAGRPTGFLSVDRLLNSLPSHRLPGLA